MELNALVYGRLRTMVTQVQKTATGAVASGITEIKTTVKDLTALKRIRVNKYTTGSAVFVSDEGAHFIWVSASTVEVNGTQTLVPSSYSKAKAPIGRWIIEGDTSTNSAAQLDTDDVATLVSLKLNKDTIDDLVKARVYLRKSGDGARVASTDETFVWVSDCVLKPNNTTVVVPNSYAKSDNPIGRWVVEGASLRTGEIPQNEQPTTTTTTQVTSLNNLILPIRTVTFSASPLSVLDTDGVLLVDTTSGNVDVSVPDPATIPVGRLFTIRKVDHSTNVVNIGSQGSALIDTLASITLNNIGGCSLISDGTHYFILP